MHWWKWTQLRYCEGTLVHLSSLRGFSRSEKKQLLSLLPGVIVGSGSTLMCKISGAARASTGAELSPGYKSG